MSIQIALDFIQHLRNSDEGRTAIRTTTFDASLENVVLIGHQSGFEFSIEDLRRAFKADWAMRARYYSSFAD